MLAPRGRLLIPQYTSWLPVVLSSVLYHSITPLHKDIQMGWDAYVHIYTHILRQTCACVHPNPDTFVAATVGSIPTHTHTFPDHSAQVVQCSSSPHRLTKTLTFSPFPYLQDLELKSSSVFLLSSSFLCCCGFLPFFSPSPTVYPQAVNENTAHIGLPARVPASLQQNRHRV